MTDLVVRDSMTGDRPFFPRAYVESSTSLGYALTVFRSQGITVDHTFGLGGDTLFQEAGYTQLSRGRLSNNLYVTAPENTAVGDRAPRRRHRPPGGARLPGRRPGSESRADHGRRPTAGDDGHCP